MTADPTKRIEELREQYDAHGLARLASELAEKLRAAELMIQFWYQGCETEQQAHAETKRELERERMIIRVLTEGLVARGMARGLVEQIVADAKKLCVMAQPPANPGELESGKGERCPECGGIDGRHFVTADKPSGWVCPGSGRKAREGSDG